MYSIHTVGIEHRQFPPRQQLIAHRCQVVAHVSEVSLVCLSSLPADAIIVVDHRTDDVSASISVVARIAHRFSGTPIVGYLTLDGPSVAFAKQAIDAGVSSLWIAGIEDNFPAMRYLFDQAFARANFRMVDSELRLSRTSSMQKFITYAFLHAATTSSVDHSVRSINAESHTLRRSLKRAGLPSPDALLWEARLLLALRLLENPLRAVRDVALALHVRDIRVLRRQLSEYVGSEFTSCRTEGTFRNKMNEFIKKVRRLQSSEVG